MQAISREERSWGMLCHLLGLAGYVIPFGNIVAPLIWWMMKKDLSSFVNDQGKEALNFQISLTIYIISAGILMIVLVGFLLLPVVLIAGLILTIIAAIKANDGIPYRYPFIIRVLK